MAGADTADGRTQRSLAKRDDVLAAAADLFTTQGFDRTSVKQLAVEARVSTATVYAHFESKEALLWALIESRSAALLARIDAATADVADPVDRLTTFVKSLVKGLAEDRVLAQVLTYQPLVTSRGVAGQVTAVEEGIRRLGMSLVDAAAVSGRLPCDDPEALSVTLGMAVRGWFVTTANRRQTISSDRLAAALTWLFENAAAPPRPRGPGRPARRERGSRR